MTEDINWTDPRQVAAMHRQSTTEGEGRQKATEARNVFAVDRSQCLKACDHGLAVAVSYLVLSCHTKGNTGITTASARAIEKLVGIHHWAAAKHIAVMQSLGLIERIDGRANPRSSPVYKFLMPATPEQVWFPNAIVRGSGITPLKILWQMQDVEALRCFAELYFWNHLPTDGGVSRGVLRLPYTRHEIGRAGDRVVWGFRQSTSPLTGDPGLVKYFERFCDLGLLGNTPHLFISDELDASMIHPYGTGRTHSPEDMIGTAAHQAGLSLISEEQRLFAQAERLWLVPVPRHIERVAMIGIARLHYQPETQTTVDWQRQLGENASGFIAHYERLSASAGEPEKQSSLGLLS